jgi:hypothetical protein
LRDFTHVFAPYTTVGVDTQWREVLLRNISLEEIVTLLNDIRLEKETIFFEYTVDTTRIFTGNYKQQSLVIKKTCQITLH